MTHSASHRHTLFISLGLGLLALLPLAVNIKAITFNCYNVMDFAIYQKAIYDISLDNLNPFIPFINNNIFNDHFDPVIFLAVLFTKIAGQGFIQLLVFEWIFFLGLLLSVLWFFRKEDSPLRASLPYLLSTLTAKLLLYPLLFPIHPTTWSCLPLFWITHFILTNKRAGIFGATLILCFFRESFAFALLPLGLFYSLKKQWALGLGIMGVSLPFVAFELHFRESLLGPTLGHGDRFIQPLLENPGHFFTNILLNVEFKAFFQFLYPFIFVFAYGFTKIKRKRQLIQKLLPLLILLAPLLFLQLYKNTIAFHYGSQFAGIFLGAMVSLRLFDHFTPRATVLGLLLFLASSLGTYTKSLKALVLSEFSKDGKKCRVSLDKLADSHLIRKTVATIPEEKTILATGGVISFVLWPNKTVDHFMGRSEVKPLYDYLLLEVNNSGDIYPAKNDDVQRAVDRCRPLATEIMVDNEYYFFARGTLTNCAY